MSLKEKKLLLMKPDHREKEAAEEEDKYKFRFYFFKAQNFLSLSIHFLMKDFYTKQIGSNK